METDITFKLQNTEEEILAIFDDSADAVPRQYEDIEVGENKYAVLLVTRKYVNRNFGKRTSPSYRQFVTVTLKEINPR